MEPEVGAWVRENHNRDTWYHLTDVDGIAWSWDAFNNDGTRITSARLGGNDYWRRRITHKQMHSPFEPQPDEPQPEELVAYVQFFRNARGELAVAASMTPEGLRTGWVGVQDNQIIKKLKVKTNVN